MAMETKRKRKEGPPLVRPPSSIGVGKKRKKIVHPKKAIAAKVIVKIKKKSEVGMKPPKVVDDQKNGSVKLKIMKNGASCTSSSSSEVKEVDEKGPCLVLGMSFVNEKDAAKYNSNHVVVRDRVRLISLKNMGWSPYTISLPESGDINSSERAPNHGRRRMHGHFGKRVVPLLKDNFKENKPFKAVFLEYVRMPGDYGRKAFNKNVFWEMLPCIRDHGYINTQTPIYVYNSIDIREKIKRYNKKGMIETKKFGYKYLGVTGMENDLFVATSKIDHKLNVYSNQTWMEAVEKGTVDIDRTCPFLKIFIQNDWVFPDENENDSDSESSDTDASDS
mmetsp:Transcript_4701/g.6991  ORF Transcript_4701/g.6991 Transcript_4701/m.6991 type:complete len:333 (+) Transcript_4701:141-1139(+)